jgi:thymidylate synthase
MDNNGTVHVFQGIKNIDKLNSAAWYTIDKFGQPLRFGDSEEIKTAKWLTSNMVIEGEALDKFKRGVMPEGWLFRGDMVKGYIDQFDDEEMWKGFEYTYAERLLKYEIPNPAYPKSIWEMAKYIIRNGAIPEATVRVNQLDHMCEQLKEAFENGIQSTRIVADLGQPHLDWFIKDIPCLRQIQVFPLPGKKVEVHFLFRSHDYGNGYGANMAMLINAINKHVVMPAGGLIVKIVLTSWVAHLYDNDVDMYKPIVEKYEQELSKAST